MNSTKGIVIATVAIQSTGRLKPWQVTTAKQMMLDHLDTGISVTALPAACGLSRSMRAVAQPFFAFGMAGKDQMMLPLSTCHSIKALNAWLAQRYRRYGTR